MEMSEVSGKLPPGALPLPTAEEEAISSTGAEMVAGAAAGLVLTGGTAVVSSAPIASAIAELYYAVSARLAVHAAPVIALFGTSNGPSSTIFKANGQLRDEVVARARLVVHGESFKSQYLLKKLTEEGSQIR